MNSLIFQAYKTAMSAWTPWLPWPCYQRLLWLLRIWWWVIPWAAPHVLRRRGAAIFPSIVPSIEVPAPAMRARGVSRIILPPELAHVPPHLVIESRGQGPNIGTMCRKWSKLQPPAFSSYSMLLGGAYPPKTQNHLLMCTGIDHTHWHAL
jgi:hypothetical protein